MQHKIILQSSDSSKNNSILDAYNKLSNQKNIDLVSGNDNSEIEDALIIEILDKQNPPLSTNNSAAYITSTLNYDTYNTNISYIGIQRQLCHVEPEEQENNIKFLNALKNDIKVAEPNIRDTENLIFDFNVLRKAEVNHLSFAYPSGLFSEEATQLFRYAGLSESNRKVIIINYDPLLADLLAQFIWYYGEGVDLRTPDHPYFKENVIEYVVDLPSLEHSLSFYKSKITGRWWYKIPNLETNKWKACEYEDYLKACEDELSDEVINSFLAV